MKELREYVDGYDYKQQCNDAAQARHCAGLSEVVGFLNDLWIYMIGCNGIKTTPRPAARDIALWSRKPAKALRVN